MGFGELSSSGSTFTAESASLWEKPWARLRQSRDCSTWRQAQNAQPYWVSARQAELGTHPAAPGIREAVGAMVRLGSSVMRPGLEKCGPGNVVRLSGCEDLV